MAETETDEIAEWLARAGLQNTGFGPLETGIALHAGEIAYGNVGIDRRLDFTVTGRAVNETAKLEARCKEVDRAILVSAEFRDLAADSSIVPVDPEPESGTGSGLYTISGFDV